MRQDRNSISFVFNGTVVVYNSLNMAALENHKHEAFARLIADGWGCTRAYSQVYEMSDLNIASSCGSRLLTHDNVSKRIKEIQEQASRIVAKRVAASRLRTVQQRVNHLEDRHGRLCAVIEDRAEDPAMQDVPGGRTGLLVKETKGIGSRDDFEKIEQYRVDTATLAELRQIEDQVAVELGQRVSRSESVSMDLTELLRNASLDELLAIRQGLEARKLELAAAPAVVKTDTPDNEPK